MNWDREDCRMSRGAAAALFLQILFDPNTTEENKERLVKSWNENARKGRVK